MTTPCICLESILSKTKCESLVARNKSRLNSGLLKLFTVLKSLKSSFVKILLVSCMSVLVSKQGIYNGYSTIYDVL